MAAITRLYSGTRVRLKRGYYYQSGKYIAPGRRGTLEYGCFTSNSGQIVFWVWWDKQKGRGRTGAWVPYQSLVRLKEQPWDGSKDRSGQRKKMKKGKSKRGPSRTTSQRSQ